MWWVLQWQRQLSTFTQLVNLLHILDQKSVITSDISLKLKTLFIRNMKVGGKKWEKKLHNHSPDPKTHPDFQALAFSFWRETRKEEEKRWTVSNRRLQPNENLHYHQYCWRRNDTGWHYSRYSKSKELYHSHLWSTRDRAAGRVMLVQTTHASKSIKIK